MSYKFGNKSMAQLETCHRDLKKIMYLAIQRSAIDFGISEGHRPLKRQNELYRQGLSKIDGITEQGKHNVFPSEAGDIYAWHPDPDTRKKIAYDSGSLCYIAGVIHSCAMELYEAGEIEQLIRWGGNWDKDGVILIDQPFDDLPHFELYKPQ